MKDFLFWSSSVLGDGLTVYFQNVLQRLCENNNGTTPVTTD